MSMPPLLLCGFTESIIEAVMSYQALNLDNQIRLLGAFAPKTPLDRMNIHRLLY